MAHVRCRVSGVVAHPAHPERRRLLMPVPHLARSPGSTETVARPLTVTGSVHRGADHRIVPCPARRPGAAGVCRAANTGCHTGRGLPRDRGLLLRGEPKPNLPPPRGSGPERREALRRHRHPSPCCSAGDSVTTAKLLGVGGVGHRPRSRVPIAGSSAGARCQWAWRSISERRNAPGVRPDPGSAGHLTLAGGWSRAGPVHEVLDGTWWRRC